MRERENVEKILSTRSAVQIQRLIMYIYIYIYKKYND